MPKLIAALLFALPLLAAAAQVGSDPTATRPAGGFERDAALDRAIGPDPMIGFTIKNGAPNGPSGGNEWAFKLGPGIAPPMAPTDQPAAFCSYEITVASYNFGPVPLTPAMASKLKVAVEVRLPDGSQVSSTAKLCFGNATFAPGYGCQGTTSVLLSPGITEMDWTVDPDDQLAEWDESNNKYRLTLEVPSPCLSASTDAAPKVAPGGTASVREALSRGLQFSRNVKPVTRPNPPKLP